MPLKYEEDYYQYDSVRTAMHVLKSYITLDNNITINADRSFGVIGFSDKIKYYTPENILQDCSSNRTIFIQEARNAWIYTDSQGLRVK